MAPETVSGTFGRRCELGAIVALLGLLVGVACSADAGSRAGGVISTEQVIRHFEQETGQRLVVSSRLRGTGIGNTELDVLALAQPDPSLGEFTIIVYLNPDVAERERFIARGSLAGRSIHWGRYRPELLGEKAYWIAARSYGNVLLKWKSDDRKTNAQWDRVDRALRTLPAPEAQT